MVFAICPFRRQNWDSECADDLMYWWILVPLGPSHLLPSVANALHTSEFWEHGRTMPVSYVLESDLMILLSRAVPLSMKSRIWPIHALQSNTTSICIYNETWSAWRSGWQQIDSPDALGARPFVLKGNAGYAEFASCTRYVCSILQCHVNAAQCCQLELSRQCLW